MHTKGAVLSSGHMKHFFSLQIHFTALEIAGEEVKIIASLWIHTWMEEQDRSLI